MEIKPYEAKVLAAILELASNEFSNHGANDFDLTKLLSLGERQELLKSMNEDNGTPEDYDTKDCDDASDWWLMSYFSNKFEKFSQP